MSLVLRSKFDGMAAAFGVCCSSFIPINMGTSGRDLLCPEGNEQVVSVRKANKMMGRTGAQRSMCCICIIGYHYRACMHIYTCYIYAYIHACAYIDINYIYTQELHTLCIRSL